MATPSEVFETEEFIPLFHLRPVLWNLSSEEYSRKTKKQDTWLEMWR
jgi:hypothetical protein